MLKKKCSLNVHGLDIEKQPADKCDWAWTAKSITFCFVFLMWNDLWTFSFEGKAKNAIIQQSERNKMKKKLLKKIKRINEKNSWIFSINFQEKNQHL